MPRRPNTPAQPERSPDQGRALLLRNLPPDLHRHIRRAAADADTSLEGYVKRLIEQDMAQANPGPATGYRYTLDLCDAVEQGVTSDNADAFLSDLVALAESQSIELVASLVQIDDNGNQVA